MRRFLSLLSFCFLCFLWSCGPSAEPELNNANLGVQNNANNFNNVNNVNNANNENNGNNAVGSNNAVTNNTNGQTQNNTNQTNNGTTQTNNNTTQTNNNTNVVVGPGPSGTGFVSYIGCSQSREATAGYQELGGTRFESWQSGGMTINDWLEDRPWEKYEQSVAGRSPEAAWMQICIRSDEENVTTYEDVKTVLAELQSRLAVGVEVYVTGLEIFDPVDMCRIAGPTVPPLTRDYADRLVLDGLAKRAPDLGPLGPNTTGDGCHANDAGRVIVGQQLLDFFN